MNFRFGSGRILPGSFVEGHVHETLTKPVPSWAMSHGTGQFVSVLCEISSFEPSRNMEVSIFSEKRVTDNYYLIPSALFELSLLKFQETCMKESKDYLAKARWVIDLVPCCSNPWIRPGVFPVLGSGSCGCLAAFGFHEQPNFHLFTILGLTRGTPWSRDCISECTHWAIVWAWWLRNEARPNLVNCRPCSNTGSPLFAHWQSPMNVHGGDLSFYGCAINTL